MLTRLKSPDAAARWLKSWVTGTLHTDSRRVQPGDGFIAWPGQATDGRRFVNAALAAGAATCLVEDEGVAAFGYDDARIATLPAMKAATGLIADAFFDHPSRTLRVIATTGTNGKTSTAWWTAQSLGLLEQPCAVVGTLGIGLPPLPGSSTGADAATGSVEYTGLTTPDPVVLQSALRRHADAGVQAVAMEASSIGIVEQRLAGTAIEVALYTNFTRDHLDYHGSMDAYWAAKRVLFGWPGLKAAVINIDDPQGAALAGELAQGMLDVWTYSIQQPARLCAQNIAYPGGSLVFDVCEGDVRVPIATKLIGDYNASNLLAVIGGLRALGIKLDEAARSAAQVTPVPGRMQRISTDSASQPEIVVDYAHTPDALDKALAALRPLADARGGRLWCVFGCGGNRDATKRPLMGDIAARRADHVVVTSDNPRDEAPQDIVDQIMAGISDDLSSVHAVVDRATAIADAVRDAAAADVLLLAGKGHEDYQEVRGVRHPYSDVTTAADALHRRVKGGAA